jgi:hypothetical protein
MLNTAMELAQCEKCKAYVFRCHVGGLLTIVDPGPLDGMEDVRRRLMMGRDVFRIVPGRKLARFGPLSTKGDGYLAEHWCTPGHVRATVIPTEAVGPLQAPVTPSAGPGLPSAPVSGSQGRTEPRTTIMDSSSGPPSRATRAIRPRTDPKPCRCDTCGEIIRHDTPDAYSIEYDGRLVYGQHVAC